MRYFTAKMAAAIGFSIGIATAAMAAFPEKPIRIIVPTAIGGPSDLCIRTVADLMYAQLGQPISVENVTGATGNIGLERVAGSPPDGYVLAQASAANTANWVARPKNSFDIVNGLIPVGKVCNAAFTLAVAPSLGVKTVDEFVRYAKARPGKLSYGSIGYGSSQHLVAEMFVAIAGLDMTHVPYRGEPAVAAEMAAGRIHMMFMAGAKPFLDGKLVVGLATTNRDTWPPIPSLPPIGKSSTLPGFSYNGWNGLMAPKGTPETVVRRLSEVLRRALADDKVRTAIRTIGNDIGAGTPEELGEQIRTDMSKFRKIIEDRHLVFPE